MGKSKPVQVATAAALVVASQATQTTAGAEPRQQPTERAVDDVLAPGGGVSADAGDDAGWASVDEAADPAAAGLFCYRLGDWEGPKRVSAGAIRGSASFACADALGGLWYWIAQLQRQSGGTWQDYGGTESDVCTPFGDIDVCGATDGASYQPGTYRIKVTLSYDATGGWETAYSPTVNIP